MSVLFLIAMLPLCIFLLVPAFRTYSDMEYVEHLENMGVFVDENGKEI